MISRREKHCKSVTHASEKSDDGTSSRAEAETAPRLHHSSRVVDASAKKENSSLPCTRVRRMQDSLKMYQTRVDQQLHRLPTATVAVLETLEQLTKDSLARGQAVRFGDHTMRMLDLGSRQVMQGLIQMERPKERSGRK